jgi:hypothetical protein
MIVPPYMTRQGDVYITKENWKHVTKYAYYYEMNGEFIIDVISAYEPKHFMVPKNYQLLFPVDSNMNMLSWLDEKYLIWLFDILILKDVKYNLFHIRYQLLKKIINRLLHIMYDKSLHLYIYDNMDDVPIIIEEMMINSINHNPLIEKLIINGWIPLKNINRSDYLEPNITKRSITLSKKFIQKRKTYLKSRKKILVQIVPIEICNIIMVYVYI